MVAASGKLIAVRVAVSGCWCPGSQCGGLGLVERGQGMCSLCEAVVCGLGLCGEVWVVWLVEVRAS